MLRLVSDRVAQMTDMDLVKVGLGVFLFVVVLSLAVHTGYALALRDLLVIRERERSSVRHIPIDDREHSEDGF